MYSSYFSNVLLIVKAVNNGARAEEEYCFEECVCANVEEC